MLVLNRFYGRSGQTFVHKVQLSKKMYFISFYIFTIFTCGFLGGGEKDQFVSSLVMFDAVEKTYL